MSETIDIKQIGQRLGKRAYEQLKPHMELIYLKIAMEAYNNLAELTPVDTGYLKLSLTTAINGAAAFVPEPRNPKAKTGDYVAAALENVANQQHALAGFKIGDIVDIGYTANYAGYVEDRQHMVKTAFAALRRIARQAFQEAKRGLP